MGRKKEQLDTKIHQTLFLKMQLDTEQCFRANDNSNITDPVSVISCGGWMRVLTVVCILEGLFPSWWSV